MVKQVTETKRQISGVSVALTYPKKPKGITFILSGANLGIDNYDSIKDTLVERGHLVVGFYINVLLPPWKNHRNKANKVKEIFRQLQNEFGIKNYSVIGHSIGGKIALLVAALHNSDNSLYYVLALDPVDQTPAEFTNGSSNLSLTDLGDVVIYVTYTDNASVLMSEEHDGKSIQKCNRNIKLISHKGAGHLVYCDGQVGSLSWANACPEGNGFKNRAVKEEILEFIKQKFATDIFSQTAAVVQDVNWKVTGKVTDKVVSGISDIGKDLGTFFGGKR